MRQIVACIDNSSSAQGVCHAAAWFGQRLKSPVTALHAIERTDLATLDMTGTIGLGTREHLLAELTELDHQRAKLAIEQGRGMLEAACSEIQTAGHADTHPLQKHAALPDALADLQDETRLVILGRQGQDHAQPEHAVGSQLETVARLSKPPILVTAKQFTEPTRAVIAYNGTDTCRRMLTRLCQSPLLQDLPIELVMAGADNEVNQATLSEAGSELETAGHIVSAQLIPEDPLIVLRDLSARADGLLCMGAWGQPRLKEFLLGSTTTETLRHAKCSVLLIR